MSSLWYPNVKQAPLQGLTGMWGGVGSNLVSGVALPDPPPDGSYTSGAFMIWDPAGYNYQSGQTTITDISGQNRDGTLNNSLENTWQEDNYGVFNTSNPNSGYIANNQGSADTALTLEFWCKPADSAPTGLWDTAPNQINTGRQNPSGAAEWWNQSPNISMGFQGGSWQHFCVVYKGNRQIVIWRNGSQYNSGSGSGGGFVWDNYCVGVYNYGNSFDGHIGLTAVYNSELSETNIQNNYQARIHRYD